MTRWLAEIQLGNDEGGELTVESHQERVEGYAIRNLDEDPCVLGDRGS